MCASTLDVRAKPVSVGDQLCRNTNLRSIGVAIWAVAKLEQEREATAFTESPTTTRLCHVLPVRGD